MSKAVASLHIKKAETFGSSLSNSSLDSRHLNVQFVFSRRFVFKLVNPITPFYGVRFTWWEFDVCDARAL